MQVRLINQRFAETFYIPLTGMGKMLANLFSNRHSPYDRDLEGGSLSIP